MQAAADLPVLAPGLYTVTATVTPDAGLDLSPANDTLSVPFFAALSQAYLPIVGRQP